MTDVNEKNNSNIEAPQGANYQYSNQNEIRYNSMDNYVDNNSTQPSKKKKTSLIILLILLFLVMLSSSIVGFLFYTRYNNAKMALKDIDKLIIDNNFKQAMVDLRKYKIDYDFGKFPEIADKKMQELQFRSEDKYRDGLKVLKSDGSKGFEDTIAFFDDYLIDYPYSSYIVHINELMRLISEYKEMLKDVETSSEVQEFVNRYGDIISIIEGYIEEIDSLHAVADRAVNSQDSVALDDILYMWYNDSEYYYSILEDIETFEEGDYDNMFFSPDEYQLLREFTLNGLLPAEVIYNTTYNYDYYTDSEAQIVRDSWDNYEVQKNNLKSILIDRRNTMNEYLANIEQLRIECDEMYEKIKNFTVVNSSGLEADKL